MKRLQFSRLTDQIRAVTVVIIFMVIPGCEHKSIDGELLEDLSHIPYGSSGNQEYPPFYTPTSQYYEYTSNGIPNVDKENYRLKIHGKIDSPVELTIEDLEKLPLVSQAQTVECIGNIPGGTLLGTAIWKGFRLAWLLDSLGMDPSAAAIKYVCADGYYSTTSVDVLRSRNILGALSMNLEPIPLKYGYPLRIMNPGFYGVKNPGWVTEIEVLDAAAEDYWESDGWKTSEPMGPDTRIFFPVTETRWSVGDTIRIGGAAYGGRRISSVEISFDEGKTWTMATIAKSTDEDYVWVFWSALFIPEQKGDFVVLSRATDEKGNRQPRLDDVYLDGNNGMHEIYLYVR